MRTKYYRAFNEAPVIEEKENERRIVGYALKFNSPSVDMGGVTERILPGSVNLAPDTYLTYNHNDADILGRQGVNLNLQVDDIGLKVDCVLPDTTAAHDVYNLLKSGIVRGMSFGFYPVRVNQVEEEEDTIFELAEMDVFETSVVVTPAYPATECYARSLQDCLPVQNVLVIPDKGRRERVVKILAHRSKLFRSKLLRHK